MLQVLRVIEIITIGYKCVTNNLRLASMFLSILFHSIPCKKKQKHTLISFGNRFNVLVFFFAIFGLISLESLNLE